VNDSKGTFTGTDNEVKRLIEDTVNRGPARRNTHAPVTSRPRDGIRHEWDFGKPIGKKSKNDGGGPATMVRVILNPDGTLRTAHPF
jgi:hypothetical protein